jgi:hypothetical protein
MGMDTKTPQRIKNALSWCIQQFIPINEELDDLLAWFSWEQDTRCHTVARPTVVDRLGTTAELTPQTIQQQSGDVT